MNEYKIRFSFTMDGERYTLYEILKAESRDQAVQKVAFSMYGSRPGFRVEKVWQRNGYEWKEVDE